MSLRYEQYNSLKITKEFLRELLYPETRPKTVKEMRERVSRCLRHFPKLKENGKPIFSKDHFDNEVA